MGNSGQFNPNYIVPPGETIQELLEHYGMTQLELANRIGKTAKTVNEIIKGKAPITPETALQLEKVFSVSASFWNNLESKYRQLLAEKEEKERLQSQIQELKRFPINFMIKQGWIKNIKDKPLLLEELFKFFGVASFEAFDKVCRITMVEPDAAFRKTETAELNAESIAVWLRQGEIEARKIQCEPYDEKGFKETLQKIRSLTLESPEAFVAKLIELCSKVGVAVVFVPETPGSRVSGATRWLSPTKVVIQLSLRYKTNDHLWFTFFHEAAHILLHSKKKTYLEFKDKRDEIEEEADGLASEMLIPTTFYKQFIKAGDYTESAIINFSKQIGIAAGIIVGRLQHDGHIPYATLLNNLKIKYEWVRKN